jgi:predicted alpha/beta superfamily hydrolase
MTTWTLQDYTPEEDEAWAMMEKEQQYEQQKKERKGNMYWNNRIVKETIKYMHDGEEVTEYYYEVSEVYYNDKDEPCGYCKATVGGETLKEAKEVYERMAEAFKFDVLDANTDFNHKFNDEEDDGKEKI